MAEQQGVRAATESLRVGHTTIHPICAPSGALLLAPGSVITPEIKQQLTEQGISHVTAHPDDVGGADESPRHAALESLGDAKGKPLLDIVKQHGCSAYSAESHRQIVGRFNDAASLIENMVKQILDGQTQSGAPLGSTAVNYAGDLAEDGDHVVAVCEELGQSSDLSERSVRMAALGIGASFRLGFDLEKAREIGICGLVHDWGWHSLPERLRDPQARLSSGEWAQVMKHPGYTVDCLKRVDGITDSVVLAAFQVHEQIDGTGYPKGLTGERIHPYAKMINVVDEYMFLTSESPDRTPYVPYDAMEYLLRQTKRGRYDSASVRALLELLSLFPIGSYIELSDGSTGRILRQNGKDFTQPVVQLVTPGTKEPLPGDSILDLQISDLEITRAIPAPDRDEGRIDEVDMNKIICRGPSE